MRIGLLTDGGFPYASGETGVWCDRLVRGLAQHEFDVYALKSAARREDHDGNTDTDTDPNPSMDTYAYAYGRRERRRFVGHFKDLAAAVCAGGEVKGDGFAEGLYGLAELAREHGGLHAALRSESAVRALESACRAPGARRAVRAASVADHLAFADRLERALRPLSLGWYGEDGLGAVDLCHATSGGAVALPGLLAKRFFGVPLLVTEYDVQLRAHYLAARDGGPSGLSAPVRVLLAAFHGLLAGEVYEQASVITAGTAHVRRWQERCGADRAKLRLVHPGVEADRFAAVGEAAGAGRSQGEGEGDGSGDPYTLVWVGRIEPAKDLVSLLHAFAVVHREEPRARLRLFAVPPPSGPEATTYLAYCKGLAAALFPEGASAPFGNAVSFEELGGGEASGPTDAEAYASGALVVLSSIVEGFPASLVGAMFSGRATVSTDAGAVVEAVGGTGLVVPPRDPRALADACLALLRDPERRERLGAAARARALELFTVEQNLTAFRAGYLELISHSPVRREAAALDADGEPLPFAHPPEAHVPGRWAGRGTASRGRTPRWAEEPDPKLVGAAVSAVSAVSAVPAEEAGA